MTRDGSTDSSSNEPAVTTVRKTRGGHIPTGTSAARRKKAAKRSTPKGERTRNEILRSGRVVFERMGYVDARVSDIVAEAGIAHGSFYTYFPSKREVFEQIILEVGAEITAAVARAPEDVPDDTIRNLENANRRYLNVHRRHMKLMVLYEQVATMDPVIHKMRVEGRKRHIERVRRTVVRLQERGVADPSIDAKPTAGALVSMLGSFAYWSDIMGYDESTTAATVTAIWAKTLGLNGQPSERKV